MPWAVLCRLESPEYGVVTETVPGQRDRAYPACDSTIHGPCVWLRAKPVRQGARTAKGPPARGSEPANGRTAACTKGARSPSAEAMVDAARAPRSPSRQPNLLKYPRKYRVPAPNTLQANGMLRCNMV